MNIVHRNDLMCIVSASQSEAIIDVLTLLNARMESNIVFCSALLRKETQQIASQVGPKDCTDLYGRNARFM